MMHLSTTQKTDATWQVPSYDVVCLRPTRKDYAVIIPVLNEGERIQAQLQAMNQFGIHRSADVVIVDGGSTDGSLDLSFLRSVHVCVLLRKTGPGKLSAQLRCGYAHCLCEGYKGVVTIDGNNKDSVEAIPDFVRELETGTDFVQGSRFIPGGQAVNTPLVRFLAIRLLHAPLLSLAAGLRWTDTTNGFRGYSRRLLLDPQVAPFRNVFQTYELLPYLTVRIPRLGYACKELPVERRYPPSGKTPTKIHGFAGYFQLLGILLRAAGGGYNPNPMQSTYLRRDGTGKT
jgi:dolichol-phosphate mannosyltransferase